MLYRGRLTVLSDVVGVGGSRGLVVDPTDPSIGGSGAAVTGCGCSRCWMLAFSRVCEPQEDRELDQFLRKPLIKENIRVPAGSVRGSVGALVSSFGAVILTPEELPGILCTMISAETFQSLEEGH